jgi:predicted ribosome quality control (RQC) complex YloA/Tae2 family protein
MSVERRWPSYRELKEQVQLLNKALSGGRIQKVRDPDRSSVALKIRLPGQSLFLTLSGDPEHGRVEVGLTQPPTLPQPTGIGRWVRAHLAGARVDSITLHPDDRVVTINTHRGQLCLELLPQAPNLYVISEDQRVMGWTKRIPSRGLRLGQPWVPPDRPEGLILETTHDDHDINSDNLSRDDALAQLFDQMGMVRPEQLTPQEQSERDERQCQKLIKQTRDRLQRLSSALWKDIERVDQASGWLQEGELLKSCLNELKRGMTEVSVTDWYDPNMAQRVITLDPKLDGLENVERRFKKHRKALKGAEIATERLSKTEAQLDALNEIAQQFPTGPIEAIRSALRHAGIYRAKQAPRQAKEKVKRLPYRVFWSAVGEKVWLGRGGIDNHLTTFQAARGQDHWVHTRDVPGAHVIIPLTHRGHIPHHETVLDAAALSVHHSKQRDEEGVALYYTERKHIRPVPAGPPGKVMVASSKTLIAEDVATRITRLYEDVKRREPSK